MKLQKRFLPIYIFFVLIIALSACAPQPQEEADIVTEENVPVTGGEAEEETSVEEAPAPEPAEINFQLPGNPPDPNRTLQDADASIRSYENRAVTGDNYLNNLYERPFTSEEMDYQPDLDIQTVDFAFDDNFFYFTIRLEGMNPDPWGLNGVYGIEIDQDLDGSGDFMIITEAPESTDWSVDLVSVHNDTNGDVGGPDPVIPNTGFTGSGFETLIELQAEQAAFSRLDPNDSQAIQIAFHRSLIDNPEEFLCGAWADNGIRDLSMFYYNDAFTLNDAGSPIRGEDYPLKDVFNLDNTCKLPFGFAQSGTSYPGMCINTPPPVQKDPPKESGCQLICFPEQGCICIEDIN